MSTRTVAIIALLAGCNSSSDPLPDQCLRRELFARCLTAVPNERGSTVHIDWDEVIRACDGVAFHQSLRSLDQITAECRP